MTEQARALAAEARERDLYGQIGRLEVRERELREALEAFFLEYDSKDGQYAPTDATEAKMRRALQATQEDDNA